MKASGISGVGRGREARARCGRAPVALLFWSFAIVLIGLPFLRARAGTSWIDWKTADPDDWTAKDPSRSAEEDVPLAIDAARFDEEYPQSDGASLVALLSRELEKHFGAHSEHLREAGIVEESRLASGRDQFLANCAGCHGPEGDGGGPAARFLAPRPRNFQKGVFKFTSTDSGQRPTRSDLYETIRRGLAGSSMPSFPLLPDERRWDLVEYVRFLAMRGEFESLVLDTAWEDGELPDADAIQELVELVDERWTPSALVPQFPGAPEPPNDAESVRKGREIYLDGTRANCVTCHGDGGRGDGASAGDYKDFWGYPVRPRDFTTGVFRAGQRAQDLYLSIATGINGTPMPSFRGVLSPEEIWHLVHYVQSLARPANAR